MKRFFLFFQKAGTVLAILSLILAIQIPVSQASSLLPQTPMTVLVGGSLTQTSYADFGQVCSLTSNTHVYDLGGGGVGLSASFVDDFDGTVLDTTQWTSNSWSGGSYTPVVSGSILTLPGHGYVRLLSTRTHGVIEVNALFGAGAWQHIGFGSDGFLGNQYLFFSTYYGVSNHLYARVNNGGVEQMVDLGAIPTETHRYTIDWSVSDASNDEVNFYQDGVLVAGPLVVSNVGLTDLYSYLSNDGSADLQVDFAQTTPEYVASGNYISCELDAGTDNVWQTISWNASLPAEAGLLVEERTSADGSTWSEWSSAGNSSGSTVNSPNRYVQYKLTLDSSSSLVTPFVNDVTLEYVNKIAPTLTASSLVGTYGSTVDLSATLSPAVSEKTISFALNGTPACAGTTDASGLATCSATLMENAGTYDAGVSANFAGDASYGPSSGTASLTVNQRDLTVSAVGVDRVYDGTTAATVNLTDNRVAGDQLTVAYGAASFADKSAGAGKTVSVSGITVTGTDAGNYTFNLTAATTASITPKTLAVTATGVNKVYDGTTAATVNLTDNRVAGDQLTVAYGAASFANPFPGVNKTVSVSGITVTGTDSGNYTFNTTAATTANITGSVTFLPMISK